MPSIGYGSQSPSHAPVGYGSPPGTLSNAQGRSLNPYAPPLANSLPPVVDNSGQPTGESYDPLTGLTSGSLTQSASVPGIGSVPILFLLVLVGIVILLVFL